MAASIDRALSFTPFSKQTVYYIPNHFSRGAVPEYSRARWRNRRSALPGGLRGPPGAAIPAGEEKDLKNRWNLLDYGDVIVHVLHKEERETYAIEKFWSHAFKVNREDWEEDSKEYSIY